VKVLANPVSEKHRTGSWKQADSQMKNTSVSLCFSLLYYRTYRALSGQTDETKKDLD